MPRAWVVHRAGEPLDVLGLEERPDPALGAGQLRIGVTAAGIALPDAFMCRGIYRLTPPTPFVPGQEVAGVVLEAGADTTIPVGTRVMAITDFVHGNGGFAEHTIADESNAYVVPDGMDDVVAAGFLIAHTTGWIGLVQRGRVEPGETVLVLGAAGGSGSAAVQLARALGATVIAVANGEERGERCRALGAHEVIDRSKEPDLRAAILRVTDGRGVDVVYDPVGGEPGEAALRCLANEGRFLVVGFAAGAWPRIDAARTVQGNYSVVGVFPAGYDRAARLAMVATMTDMITAGALAPAVEPVSFASLPEAVAGVAGATILGRPVAVI